MKYTGAALPNNATLEGGLPAAAKREGRPEDRVLSADAKAWFAGLPMAVRPIQLSRTFPRICNGLAEHWPEPERVISILDDLLLDKRGGRQGFPLPIVMEISILKEHFLATYVSCDLNIWDSTPGLY